MPEGHSYHLLCMKIGLAYSGCKLGFKLAMIALISHHQKQTKLNLLEYTLSLNSNFHSFSVFVAQKICLSCHIKADSFQFKPEMLSE